jgi:hypothetical protein
MLILPLCLFHFHLVQYTFKVGKKSLEIQLYKIFLIHSHVYPVNSKHESYAKWNTKKFQSDSDSSLPELADHLNMVPSILHGFKDETYC